MRYWRSRVPYGFRRMRSGRRWLRYGHWQMPDGCIETELKNDRDRPRPSYKERGVQVWKGKFCLETLSISKCRRMPLQRCVDGWMDVSSWDRTVGRFSVPSSHWRVDPAINATNTINVPSILPLNTEVIQGSSFLRESDENLSPATPQ